MSAIYLLRHGQAHFGSADYDRLSALGQEQARVLGAALAPRLKIVDRVICGAMQRHRQTAEGCLAAMNLPTQCTEDAAFNEYDHGEIVDRFIDRQSLGTMLNAAKDRARALEDLFKQGMLRWQGGAHDAEYSEPWPVFRTRCLGALDRLVSSLVSSETVLVFTSGGVISVIAQHLLKLPLSEFPALNWRLANGGVSKLVCGSSGLFLSTLNEHAHFEGEQQRLLTYR